MIRIRAAQVAAVTYELIVLATFAKLTFLDGYAYTWTNWLFAIPANLFLSAIWPIYWLILRPIMGS